MGIEVGMVEEDCGGSGDWEGDFDSDMVSANVSVFFTSKSEGV